VKLSETKKRRFSFFSINFTYFVDNLGWSIVFPIFAPLFLDSKNLIFSSDVSLAMRTALLGIFLGAFPFAQFIGAPLLGEFADKSGRKRALILSVALTFVGYALSAWSVKIGNLPLLFIARIITGIFSGNLSICLASISDLSKEEKIKIKNFSYLSVLVGFAFIVGAFLGGKFSDSLVNPYFTPDLPLWIAAFLSFLNLFFIIFAFTETSKPNPKVKFKFFESFENIHQALKIKNIKRIYLIYFLFIFAWTMLFQFAPVLVISKFKFTHSQIGDLAAFMGICWAIGSGIVNRILLSKFENKKILEYALFFFIASSAVVGFLDLSLSVLVVLGICGAIGGVAWPICTGIISSKVSQNQQGKILGISQSMQSLAMATSPVIGGYLSRYFMEFPFVAASFAAFLGVLVYVKGKI
jgi:DHA1 family tetracycline resistance protein-like MFS transporter